MKILLVSSYLPYPLFSGGHIRLFNIIKELSKRHKITLVCEKRDYQTDKDVNEVKKLCENVIVFRRKKQWSMENIIKTAFSREPFLVVGHTNRSMRIKIEELLTMEKFDLIHAETFYIMQNIPKTRIPIVLAEHNIEYLVYKRYADLAPKIFKFLFYVDVWKMKTSERSFWLKASRIIAVSEEEKKIIGYRNVSVVPNGVDLKQFRIQNSEFRIQNGEKRVLFIGDFKWMQNIDSAKWILKDIWPEISSKFPTSPMLRGASKVHSSKLTLWIVGKNIPESIKKLVSNQEDIIFDEDNRQKTSEIFQQADVLLAPIRVGGGTSFKILEAMASGVPVVATRLGIEGIAARDKEEVLIADDPSLIAFKTTEILNNNNHYQEIAIKARRLIEEKYDWKIIVKKLEEVYSSAVK